MSESNGEWFSLVGESGRSAALPIASEDGPSRERGLPVVVAVGENRPTPSEASERPGRWEAGEGVFTGDDFWGDMDLARSVGPRRRAS